MSKFVNGDCMEGMKEYPDKYFDLAIVDPPYGGSEKYFGSDKRGHMGGGHMKRFNYGHWDIAPDKAYFDELFRVSKNQIIWGGNYFELPPTRCFVIWKKLTISENFTMAMAEYAWASFNENAKVFECMPQGRKGDKKIHPTQKPIDLYKWLLSKYAKKGDLILDTHVGSGSSLIACEDLGYEYVGYEIDETYYKAAKQRIKGFNDQLRLKI